MGWGTSIKGCNRVIKAPNGDEDRIADMEVFDSGRCLITVWELSDEEIAEIIKTKRIYVSVLGRNQPPMFLGSEKETRLVTLDYGSLLPKQET